MGVEFVGVLAKFARVPGSCDRPCDGGQQPLGCERVAITSRPIIDHSCKYSHRHSVQPGSSLVANPYLIMRVPVPK